MILNILFINPTTPKILIGMEYKCKFLSTESVVLQNLKENNQELQSEKQADLKTQKPQVNKIPANVYISWAL